ncbi:cytochrome b/b6 domain-containing protein [Microcella alkaliphila]|uniref:Transporter n=1 Tax=Microcella alkaliphila TaxID=279828 RepID=A0A0U5BF11_9MICO|nr:hypothetical protein [Microcella alkaliphila]BAU31790.1 transporter [Microcella alkaliphila]
MSTAPARPRRRTLIWLIPAALITGIAMVAFARWLRLDPSVAQFIASYPGTYAPPPGTPEGYPGWLSWTHFLNGFFLLFIVSSGLHIRSKTRPIAFWTRRVREGDMRRPTRMSIHTWWHLVVVVGWLAVGLVYVVLLAISGHWMRLIPTDWAVVPNALSGALQYASLDLPRNDSWVSYNALQQLAYASTVVVAAPLALATGLRLSPLWPEKWMRAHGPLSDTWARQTHRFVLWFYIAFTIVHTGLVLGTGARLNLNKMYAGINDGESPLGWILFAGSLAVMAAAWVLLRPPAQVAIAERTGDVRRMPAVR